LTKNPPAGPPPVLVNTPVVAPLALFTASPDVPAAALVFVTCNWIPGEAPVSVDFASTEFDTPRLNTPPTPLPASATAAPPTSPQTKPTTAPFKNDAFITTLSRSSARS
jgi:hypothetical protein